MMKEERRPRVETNGDSLVQANDKVEFNLNPHPNFHPCFHLHFHPNFHPYFHFHSCPH